ncbi:hypothetical protein ETB97_000736 [Aspergillus alliaceus]|uniref:Uncharacterized protein n=1 Tax=Petromyces alliaceus TaxID=209559 RepID=A0A8H6ACS8_PETAA|nr:hypothetical protein ETB97_000736 [Aspergillus burnettii]
MIQLKELPPPPPYSETQPSPDLDQRYDEEAAYDDYQGLERVRRNTIRPGATERWWNRGLARRICCILCIIMGVAALPYVILALMMSQYRF